MRQLIIILTATHAVLLSQAAFNNNYLQQRHRFNRGRIGSRLPDSSSITSKVSKENNDQAAGAHHTDPMELLPQLHTYQKPRQKRRPQTTLTRPRKPRFYWHDEENMRLELKSFWEDDLNVTISEYYPNELPPIPSEFLLNHFNRNDLRWGIAQIGGRETLSHVLGGAFIIPGKWKEAKKLGIIQRLMHLIDDDTGVSSTKKSKGTAKSNSEEINAINREPLISMVQPTDALKQRKEFWSKEKAIRELYCYLDNYKKYKSRPSVFMPQLSELKHEGYQKLFNACSRFKKLPQGDAFGNSIQYSAGLVPYKEWRFFESQLQLFVELQHYLNLHHEGKEDTFPDPDVVKKRGHVQLSHLIRTHGGKLLLAQKLDMELAASTMSIQSWGQFSLNFAIQLLQFIREQYMTISPPLTFPIISMPSEQDLIRFGYDDLKHQISRFGGYENVARRLGLAYFDGKNEKVDEGLVRRAKRLWKQMKS